MQPSISPVLFVLTIFNSMNMVSLRDFMIKCPSLLMENSWIIAQNLWEKFELVTLHVDKEVLIWGTYLLTSKSSYIDLIARV